MKKDNRKRQFFKDKEAYESEADPCYVIEPVLTGRYYREDFEETAAALLDGNDCDTVQRWGRLIFERCNGQKPEQTAAQMKQELLNEMNQLYREGTEVYLLPYNKEDSPGLNKVIRYEEEVTMITDGYTEQEVTLSEIHRKADHVCPRCGSRLYHEKWNNTQDHYPYVCFACDENFFNIEIKK